MSDKNRPASLNGRIYYRLFSPASTALIIRNIRNKRFVLCRKYQHKQIYYLVINMRYGNNKASGHASVSSVGTAKALVIKVIVFAALLPQSAAVPNSWDSKQGSGDQIRP